MTAFWDVVPCSLMEVNRRFRGGTASIITLMMEAVCIFERRVTSTRLHGSKSQEADIFILTART
jgi:hypothetical protein